MIRVMIIAPSIAVRAGLSALISDEPEMEVVAEAANLVELKNQRVEVDVVVWAPGFSAEEDQVRMELQDVKMDETLALLLILDDPAVIKPLAKLKIRAWGLLNTEFTRGELVSSLQSLNEGLAVADPAWIRQAYNNYADHEEANQSLIEPLTSREIEILQLLAYGLTNKQIAARLKISAHTVKFHISMIYNKMGTSNRVETVNQGLKKGLIIL